MEDKVELQAYRNRWGFETVTIEEEEDAQLNANGITLTVWDLVAGSPTYHQDRWQAELHAQLLATYYADYARDYQVEENPAIKHRKGIVRGGAFSGLPVAFKDGVAGVNFWGRFTPLA